MNWREAADVAVKRMGAPSDIESYTWVKATKRGESFSAVVMADQRRTVVQLNQVDERSDGTLLVGWDKQARRAAFAWVPAED